jgi:hypothetical protein
MNYGMRRNYDELRFFYAHCSDDSFVFLATHPGRRKLWQHRQHNHWPQNSGNIQRPPLATSYTARSYSVDGQAPQISISQFNQESTGRNERSHDSSSRPNRPSFSNSQSTTQQGPRIRSLAPDQVTEFVTTLFRTDLIKNMAITAGHPFAHLIAKVAQRPLFVYNPNDHPASRLNFTAYVGLLALRHNQYENPLIADLYLLHELYHIWQYVV